MKKYFPHISSLLIAIVFIFAMSGLFVPQTAEASWWDTITCSVFPVDCALSHFISFVVGMVLKLVSLLTGLAGIILNGVVYLTVVKVADNYSSIPAINVAWKVVRDVANMGFIFVLLYAAIQTILGTGTETRKIIVNIIIAAILINFSLFFTKIVIDASNVLALLFYDAIVPGALNAAGGLNFAQAGLSNAFMQHLSLQSLFKISEGGIVTVPTVITVGIMGSIMLLIASFVFFAVAIMFIIRYVVLILVLILSPIAFVSFALPGLKGQGRQWLDALIGQALFAPIYFLLTWITLQVLGGVMGSFGAAISPTTATSSGVALAAGITTDADGNVVQNLGTLSMFINFIVVIVFLIASLLISKKWADRTPGGVSKLTSWATSSMGGAAFGGMGAIGRNTFGRAGAAVAGSARLQEDAKTKIGLAGAGARLALYAGKKARSSSFDVRSATIPTSSLGALVEGTAGRTNVGKKLGLNEVNIPSVPVGSFAAGQTGVGAGETAGFKETQEAKAKRIETREKTRDEEYRKVQAKATISEGIGATPGSPQYIAMEKTLASMTDKEVEAIVDTNRELLDSQAFANSISVKQLEALNKSDQFSEAEKDTLKSRRFGIINTAVGTGGAAITAAGPSIKALADSELELIDPAHLNNIDFVSQLRPAQVEAIQKSNKFSGTQKTALRTLRKQPLINAIASGNPAAAQNELRKIGPKDIVALGTGTRTTPGTLLDPILLKGYTPNMLKRMAQEMNTADIQTLRGALLGPPVTADPETETWLINPLTGAVDFS